MKEEKKRMGSFNQEKRWSLDRSMGNDVSGNTGCFQHGCKCWKRIHVVRVCGRSFLIVYMFLMKYKAATSVENEDGGRDVEVEER